MINDNRQSVKTTWGNGQNPPYSPERHVAQTVGVIIWELLNMEAGPLLCLEQAHVTATPFILPTHPRLNMCGI